MISERSKGIGRKVDSFIKTMLIFAAIIVLIVIILVPLAAIFARAFDKGVVFYLQVISDAAALEATLLTLKVMAFSVPINAMFGIIFAWTVTKYRFRGRNFLVTLIDLPFAISPIVAGLMLVLLFSTSHGLLGELLRRLDWQIMFSTPGIIIATIFVTVPFVARELIPIMESQGSIEEEAALILGASGWKTFWFVTIPNIRWGLFYGMILTAARSAGEFGAVSVVSGHIRGLTNTLPLHVEILYNEYQFSAAFSVATLLSLIGIINLIVKKFAEAKSI